MNKFLGGLWMAALILAAPAAVRADFILSVTTAADANHLTVGQDVTFNVAISGVNPLDANTFLSFLAATLQYDTSLLTAPAAVNPGAAAADPLNFVGTPLSNGADGFYDSVFFANSPTPISTSDIFYSFDVATVQAGSGTITFSAAAATLASDSNQNDQFTPDTVTLSFTIEPQLNAAPAPAGVVLALTGVAAVGAVPGWRRLMAALRRRMIRNPGSPR